MLNDNDFVTLFNKTVDLAKPVSSTESFATSVEDNIKDLNLDSLDYVMLGIYWGDVYGVDEHAMRSMRVSTLAELREFLEQHKTRDVETLDSAMENL